MARLVVEIPEAEHRQLKAVAAMSGMTISAMIRDAVKPIIGHDDKEPASTLVETSFVRGTPEDIAAGVHPIDVPARRFTSISKQAQAKGRTRK